MDNQISKELEEIDNNFMSLRSAIATVYEHYQELRLGLKTHLKGFLDNSALTNDNKHRQKIYRLLQDGKLNNEQTIETLQEKKMQLEYISRHFDKEHIGSITYILSEFYPELYNEIKANKRKQTFKNLFSIIK